VAERPVVAIYRHELLAATETFIRSQAQAMGTFEPIYIGLRTIAGLDLPADRVVVAESGSVPRIRSTALRLGIVSRSFVERIRAYRPALLHAHFESDGIVALPIARALGIPLVVTAHGFDATMDDRARMPNPLVRRFYMMRRRQLQRSGALFIAVSDHIGRALVARGYPAERIRVHHIGVDPERLAPPPDVEREPVVLFVGRLVEKKGGEFLVRAMPAVAEAVPGARAVFIGEGPLRRPLETLARELQAPVDFLGRRPYAEVIESMQRARVLSVPTVRAANGDMDGCAMVLVEAQAAGAPVVSFHSGGSAEAVVDGSTGWLARERDVQGLARGIIDLLVDHDRWRDFSLAGRAHVARDFDVRKQSALLERLYDEVIGREQA
jgi:glycosyltransferase involved in cell wall biosynthesis